MPKFSSEEYLAAVDQIKTIQADMGRLRETSNRMTLALEWNIERVESLLEIMAKEVKVLAFESLEK